MGRRAAVAVLPLLIAGCGGADAGAALDASWSFDRTALEAGRGIPFCESAMADVADFMRDFEGRPPPSGDYGGTVVMGGIGEISGGMNSFAPSDTYATQHQIYVHGMTLVRYDSGIEPEPYLAESWEVNAEETAITFHLRDDVYWHDGERTDAHDVAFTYRRMTDPETGADNDAFWTHYDTSETGVEVVDSFTVVVRLRPHAEFMDPWTSTSIMPEHLLRDVPPAELADHPIGTVCPVGNGPFLFTEHRQDASWAFQANPAFPEALGGRPYVDRYVYRSIPEQSTLLVELLTGGIDVYLSVTPEQVERVIESEVAELVTFPHRNFVFVAWNARRPQLADKRVRQALTMGTDRQEILEGLVRGYGTLANGSLPPFHWAYDPALGAGTMPHDPEGAAELLTEAGWVDRDGDGIRENAAGEPLRISIKYNPDYIRRGIAEVMQAQLASIGVEIVPTVLEWGTILEQVTTSARDFDGVVISLTADFRVDDTGLFHSEHHDGSLALSGTERPDIDRLLERLPLVSHREEARGIWAEYQELLIDEQPFTFIYFPERLTGVSSRLEGVELDLRGEWRSLPEWRVPPESRRR